MVGADLFPDNIYQ